VLTSATPLLMGLGRVLQAGGWGDAEGVSGTIEQAINVGLSSMTASNGLLGAGDWQCIEVLSYNSQVVAGMNYKITAEFKDMSTNSVQTVEFVVYQPPGGEMTLTSANVLLQ